VIVLQVLGSLKQKIDQILANEPRVDELLAEAHAFLVEREDRLTNARRLALEASASGAQQHMRNSVSTDSFTRGKLPIKFMIDIIFGTCYIKTHLFLL